MLSCVADADTTPLIVLEPPPLSREEYDGLYARYSAAREKSMENIVGYEYRVATGTFDAIEARSDAARHYALHKELAAPRSWLIHGRRWAELLKAVGCQRAVFLFDPTDDDLVLWPNGQSIDQDRMMPPQVEADRGTSLLPADAERIVFVRRGEESPRSAPSHHRYTYADLTGLTDLASNVLQGRDIVGPAELGVAADVGSVLVSLHAALERGVPLRLDSAPAPSPRERPWRQTGPADAAEAVMIETAESATSLAGVLYARNRRASLFTCSVPDVPRIEAALAAFADLQREAVKSDRLAGAERPAPAPIPSATAEDPATDQVDVHDLSTDATAEKGPALREFIRKYLYGDHCSEALREIERIVSAVVPGDLVAAIGDAPLTVFTSGVPYTFVRTDGQDWSRKPIGHIALDAPLMVAADIWQEGKDTPDVPFAAIFDPGFFRGETRDVLAAMDREAAHPMVFEREAAGIHAVLLASHLPLDLLFFNTHGSEDAIVLGDTEWRSDGLGQWVVFPSAPIVFNNSCLSWQGVGRQFVRAGARGYIGTLWPVPAPAAASIAARSIADMAAGTSVCAAIAQARNADPTGLAYIFVGTTGVRVLGYDRNSVRRGRAQYVLSVLHSLLNALLGLSRDLRYEHDRSLVCFVYHEAEALLARAELQNANAAELYGVRLKQLQVLAALSKQLDVSLEQAEATATECFRLAELQNLPDEPGRKQRAEIFRLRANVREARGDSKGAISDLMSSEAGSWGDADEGDLLLQVDLADLLKRTGEWERARTVALAAKRDADARDRREARMRLAGVLGQVEQRLGNLAVALEYAREGLGLAIDLGNRPEQSEFRLDEARVHLMAGDAVAAIDASNEAGRIARAAMDVVHDLQSYGVSAQAHLRQQRTAASRACARQGLVMASRLRNVFEIASFSFDLGRADEADGDLHGAVTWYRQAVTLWAKCGRHEMLLSCGHIVELAIRTSDWMKIETVLSEQLVLQALLPPQLRTPEVSRLLGSLKTVVFIGAADRVRQALDRLMQWCAQLLAAASEDRGAELYIIGRTLRMLAAWFDGAPEAQEIAADLDMRWSDGSFAWRAFVAKPRPQ